MTAILQIFSNAFSWLKICVIFWKLHWSEGPIDNKPALVQIIACCWTGDKPLSEPWWPNLIMHICVTWPQWVNEAQVPSKVSSWWSVNSSPPRATYLRRWTGSALVQIMAWRQISNRPLSEPMLIYCQLESWEQISVKFESEFYHFHSRKCIRKCHLPNWQPFCPGEIVEVVASGKQLPQHFQALLNNEWLVMCMD